MNIVIIEDEPQTARTLEDIILEVNPDAIILASLESVSDSISFLSNPMNSVDLIFADIQLTDGLSFDIFSKIQSKCPIIFCTAFDQYTLQAFKTNGIEYLLKPVKKDDVIEAFSKYNTLKESLNTNEDIIDLIKKSFVKKQKYKASLLVHHRESYIPVEVNNIALLMLDTEILYIYTFNKKKFPIYKTLTEIESEIDPALFFRINRQVLINRNSIKEVQPYFHRKVVVKTDLGIKEQLIVSRVKVSEFMDWLEQS
jgi:DNA-binding LytR/AlgR family response regulator